MTLFSIQDIQYDYRGQIEKEIESLYNQHIATSPKVKEEDIDDDNRDDKEDEEEDEAYIKTRQSCYVANDLKENSKQIEYFLDSASRSSLGEENADHEIDIDNSCGKSNRKMSKSLSNNCYARKQSKNFNYSPDTTDYDSNYGDFDFESESPLRFAASDYINLTSFNTSATATVPSATVDLSGGPINNYARYCTSMPVLEDGLSSGHASDNENNNPIPPSIDKNYIKRNSMISSISTIQKQYHDNLVQSKANNIINCNKALYNNVNNASISIKNNNTLNNNDEVEFRLTQSPPNYHSFYPARYENSDINNTAHNLLNNKIFKNRDPEMESLYTISKFL